MVHAHIPAPYEQLGQLLERPSPARITAFSGVIALHAAALVLLMLPMAAPEPTPLRDEPATPYTPVIKREPLVVPVAPTPPTPPRNTVTTRRVETTPPQPPILVEDGAEAAPPIDQPVVEETTIAPIDTGPVPMERLDYASAPPPPYPPDALRRRVEGTVLLQVLVDVDGRPIEARVQRSSGHRSLDEAARKQVLKRWMFRPAMRNGTPVQAIGLVPIRFSMQ
jgi:periplasmic protein TonB